MRPSCIGNACPFTAGLSWLCYMLPGQHATDSERQCVQSGPFKAAQTGVLKLGLGSTNRDGYLYVPQQYDPNKAGSFILAIHAAGKSGIDALQLLYSSAASSGKSCQACKSWRAGNKRSIPVTDALPATVPWHKLKPSCGLHLPGKLHLSTIAACCNWLCQQAATHH